MKETIVVQFQGGYVQGYFEDGSTIAWQNDSVSYVSPLSIQTSHSLSKLPPTLHGKINHILLQLNKYNDCYFISPFPQQSPLPIFKKYKIKEYIWQERQVKQCEDGMQIRSDDNNARLTLSMDGYMVTVKYLQLTPGKKIGNSNQNSNSNSNSYAQNRLSNSISQRNITKMLLEKYNYKYVQFPNFPNSNPPQILYQYRQITKIFTIFNIPQRWHYPLHIVTQYSLANSIFPPQLCYIDFQDNQPQSLSPMPPVIDTRDSHQQHNSEDIPRIIMYGTANNHKILKWISVGQMFGVFSQVNVFYDGVGYWFRQDNKIGYKSMNKPSYQYKYKEGFLPYKIRNQGQKERDIKGHLSAFISYCNHNAHISHLQLIKEKKSVKNDVMQDQQLLPQVGVFKYYAPNLLIGRFVDSVMAYLQNGTDLTIVSHGQTIKIGLLVGVGSEKEYQWHTNIMVDMWEKGFNRQQWEEKQRIKEDLQRIRIGNQAMLAVCKKYI